MMEAIRISETSVNFNVSTWRYIPEDSKLQNGTYLSHYLTTLFRLQRFYLLEWDEEAGDERWIVKDTEGDGSDIHLKVIFRRSPGKTVEDCEQIQDRQ
jgi:hypothetical protein